MKRTPYGVGGSAGNFISYLKALADEGYIFVFQDLRGKVGSEGTFVMQSAPRAPGNASALDEAPIRTTRSSGCSECFRAQRTRRMLGISYDGLDDHHGRESSRTPALKAISPQAVAGRYVAGDDFHHNGAFRLS